MYLYWRYLILQYTKFLLLTACSLIAIILVAQLDKIAKFAALCTNLSAIIPFTWNQIFFLIPLTIPIASLIASLLLFQKLSKNHELTAFRVSGLSCKQIITPVLLMGAVVGCLNFAISAHITPPSWYKTQNMLFKHAASNPIFLLKNAKYLALQGTHIQMDPIHHGNIAEHFLSVTKAQKSDRLALVLAKKLILKRQKSQPLSLNIDNESEDLLVSKHMSMLVSKPSFQPQDFDQLLIENQNSAQNFTREYSFLLGRSHPKFSHRFLPFKQLRIHIADLKQKLSQTQDINARRGLQKALNKSYACLFHHFTIGFLPLAFTLLGASFSIEINRNPSKKKRLSLTLLGMFALCSLIIDYTQTKSILLSLLLSVIPSLIIIILSFRALKSVARGIE